MICFADSVHIVQALFIFDFLYYLIVPLDDYDAISAFYVSFNFSMTGLALLEIEFPDTTQINNPYVIGGILVITLILIIMAAYSGAVGAMITGLALLIIAGVTVASFEQY